MTLSALLDAALDAPDNGFALACALDHRSRDVAVLVVDMAGFSRITVERGLCVALLAIRRLQLVALAATVAHGGHVVKFVADNVFAVFPDVPSAVAAAGEIVAQIPSSAGVGYGRTLLIDGDLFGAEVNAASRLGEDVATAGEVLLTEGAQRFVAPTPTHR